MRFNSIPGDREKAQRTEMHTLYDAGPGLIPVLAGPQIMTLKDPLCQEQPEQQNMSKEKTEKQRNSVHKTAHHRKWTRTCERAVTKPALQHCL